MRVAIDGPSSRIHLGSSMTRPKLPSCLQFQAVETTMPKHLNKPSHRPDNMAIGSTEIVILVVFGILIFGANKIPQLARGLEGPRENSRWE